MVNRELGLGPTFTPVHSIDFLLPTADFSIKYLKMDMDVDMDIPYGETTTYPFSLSAFVPDADNRIACIAWLWGAALSNSIMAARDAALMSAG